MFIVLKMISLNQVNTTENVVFLFLFHYYPTDFDVSGIQAPGPTPFEPRPSRIWLEGDSWLWSTDQTKGGISKGLRWSGGVKLQPRARGRNWGRVRSWGGSRREGPLKGSTCSFEACKNRYVPRGERLWSIQSHFSRALHSSETGGLAVVDAQACSHDGSDDAYDFDLHTHFTAAFSGWDYFDEKVCIVQNPLFWAFKRTIMFIPHEKHPPRRYYDPVTNSWVCQR